MLDRFTFKLLLAFLMVLDHIDAFVPQSWNLFFGIISRCVAVGFAYLAVEGFTYTKNIKKYIFRLFLFAIIMMIGNYFLNQIFVTQGIKVHNSIIMTLALGVTMLYFYTNIDNKLLRIIAVVILIIISNYFEGGFIIMLFMLFTYKYRDDERKRNIAYFIIAGVLFAMAALHGYTTNNMVQSLLWNYNYFFVIIIPILKLYNGKNGLNNAFSKYFFYIFYMGHLWIIAGIRYFMALS